MLKYTALVTILGVFALWRAASAQEPTEIDFGRDVQPLFKAHCIDCHGPDEQKNGFRLDRRQDALRGGVGVDIGPGSSDASRLYLRLIVKSGTRGEYPLFVLLAEGTPVKFRIACALRFLFRDADEFIAEVYFRPFMGSRCGAKSSVPAAGIEVSQTTTTAWPPNSAVWSALR